MRFVGYLVILNVTSLNQMHIRVKIQNISARSEERWRWCYGLCCLLKLPRVLSRIEVLAIEATLGRHEAIVLGVYSPPRVLGSDYYIRREEDRNELCTWASLQKQFVVIIGDLNLNRLRPDLREGKILCDLE